MAIHAAFFKDENFGGDVDTRNLGDSHRYLWVKYGSNFGDEISSFSAHAFGSHGGNVYGMTAGDFTGKFISLNVKINQTAHWASLGAFEDSIESVLMVNRNANEFELELAAVIIPDFNETLDNMLHGTRISREGNPSVFTSFWPAHDPANTFVSIRQNLHISVEDWYDYEGGVQYDILPTLNKSGHVVPVVNWIHIWVDEGIIASDILNNRMKPPLVANIEFLGVNMRFLLSSDSGNVPAVKFKGFYLLPGPRPTSALGEKGDTKSNSTLVLLL